MRSRDSRIEYARRMHRVVEHIDRHLDDDLDLATLAAVAHFSPYHFHRLFAAWLGETLGDYLRRRRLEVAATRLAAQPRLPVLDVALSVGFGSREAFAHAFKARFGMSASAWRRTAQRNRDQALRKANQDDVRDGVHDGDSMNEEKTMDGKLVDRAPVTIVYLRYVGPYGPPLGRFWQQTVMPWLARRGLEGCEMLGISHDNPNVTDPAKCRCDVGVVVDDGFVPIGDEHVTTVPGGRYAAGSFLGTVDEIGAAWTTMMRDWLPASGMQLDARPMFERYLPRKEDGPGGRFACEITIPVAPL